MQPTVERLIEFISWLHQLLFFFSFCRTGDGAQDLLHAKQTVSQVSYILYSLSIFKVKFIEVPFTYSKAHSFEAYR